MSNENTFTDGVTYFGIGAGPALQLRGIFAKEIGPMRVQDQVDAIQGLTREFRRWTPQSKRIIRSDTASPSRNPAF
jgi:hypothetical protein